MSVNSADGSLERIKVATKGASEKSKDEESDRHTTKHDTEIPSSHQIGFMPFLNVVEVKHQCPQGVIVVIGQFIDEIEERLVLGRRIPKLDSRHELVMQVVCEQGIRKRAKVGFEDRRDATDVIEAIRVPQIEGRVVAPLE